jgi:hypothetical protein
MFSMLSHRSTLLRRIIETPGDTVPQRICNLSAATNMDGVAILLNTDHRLVGTVASAGKVGQILAELELSLGEGPAHQAIAERAMVSADQLLFGSRDRWPVFAEHAVGAGIEAVFALPLQLGSIMVGVIEFARAMPGSLDSQELIDLANLSSLTTSALLLTQARVSDSETLDLLQVNEPTQLRIHQATGMVSQQAGVSLADGLALMRAYSLAHGASLSETAQKIVARELRMDES